MNSIEFEPYIRTKKFLQDFKRHLPAAITISLATLACGSEEGIPVADQNPVSQSSPENNGQLTAEPTPTFSVADLVVIDPTLEPIPTEKPTPEPSPSPTDIPTLVPTTEIQFDEYGNPEINSQGYPVNYPFMDRDGNPDYGRPVYIPGFDAGSLGDGRDGLFLMKDNVFIDGMIDNKGCDNISVPVQISNELACATFTMTLGGCATGIIPEEIDEPVITTATSDYGGGNIVYSESFDTEMCRTDGTPIFDVVVSQ